MILCAVDESDAGSGVLDTARWLADGLGAALAVIHAVADSERGADALVSSVRARLADEHADVRLVEGSPAQTIIETARGAGAELIVVGSRGRGPLRSAVLGSVSRELATRAPCPVVIVPSGRPLAAVGGEDGDRHESVVCGVDGSDIALAAAAFAGQLARRLGCRLVVVHARQNLRAAASYPRASSATPPVTGQEDAVRESVDAVIQRAQEAAGVSTVSVVEPGPPTEVLESVADREAGRLIVIAARGTGGLRAAVLGSVSLELPSATARPVVVVSDPAAAAVRGGP